jgi:hypothetical protein
VNDPSLRVFQENRRLADETMHIVEEDVRRMLVRVTDV